MTIFRPVARDVERKREAASKRINPIDLAFGEQRRAIECHEPFVAFCCSGRSGKSRGAVIKWLEVAERKPGQLSCFIALTLAQAERIAWRQLARMNKELQLGLTFNKGEHTVHHPNGSALILLGANRDDLIDVLRGTPFAFVYFDEAAFFREGLLKQAVEDALLIRMLDLQGEMWVASTPGYVKAGYHYELVSGTRPGWQLFHWTYFDNPHLPEYPLEPDAMKRRLLRIAHAANIRETQGWTEESPSYMREWRGLYADDLEALVYAFRPEIHYVDDMPRSWYEARNTWRTVLGIDFGSTAATAWVLWAVERHSPVCYAVKAYKVHDIAPSDTADVTKAWIDDWHPDVIVGDSAAKSYIDEHRKQHRIPIQGADKLGKRAHQMTMNDAFRFNVDGSPAPRIRIVRDAAGCYGDELLKLGKDRRYGINHEKYGTEDQNGVKDLCDAGLYGFNRAHAWVEEYLAEEHERKQREEQRRLQLARLREVGSTSDYAHDQPSTVPPHLRKLAANWRNPR